MDECMLKCIINVRCEQINQRREACAHTNIHGGAPEHEIIIHHRCIIIPSVSTKVARRCADDFEC
jgi:hypothetical protein